MTEANGYQLAEIARLIDAGRVKPKVQSTYPLERVADAQTELEHAHVEGKLVLDLTPA
jgi:NADPH:quinone reductase-like Zn-dependent oxidoreductase